MSRIAGTAPSFGRLKFLAGQADITVAAEVTRQLSADSGAMTTGTGWIELNAPTPTSGTVAGPGMVHEVRSVGGTWTVAGSASVGTLRVQGGRLVPGFGVTFSVVDLRLEGGRFDLTESSNVNLSGDLYLVGGEFETSFAGGASPALMDVQGDVYSQGTVSAGVTSPAASVRFHGTWFGDAPFDLVNSFVEAADMSRIAGTAPSFGRLKFLAGQADITVAAEVTTLLSTDSGATTTGAGWIRLNAPVSGTLVGLGSVHDVRNVGGTWRASFGSTISMGTMRIEGGRFDLTESSNVNISGDLYLVGGEFETSFAGGASPALMDVQGDVYSQGTVSAGVTSPAASVRFHGTWFGDAPFDLFSSFVEAADGATLQGSGLAFRRFRVAGVGVSATSDLAVSTALDFGPGADLSMTAADLSVSQFSWSVSDATLTLGSGSALRRPASSTTVFASGSTLELIGARTSPAGIRPLDTPGASFTVQGEFSPVDFDIRGLSAAGLVLDTTATIGPAGFRDGVFDSGISGVLLDARTTAAFTGTNIAFEDTDGVMTSNVRRTSGLEITFLNWGGAFGGPDNENDPSTNPLGDPDGAIVWVDSSDPDLKPIIVAGPTKAVGGDQVMVSWTVLNQGAADAVVPWSDQILLSTDNVIDASDTVLATVAASSNLLMASQVAQSVTVTIPMGLDGQFFLGVLADVFDEIVETGAESNNAGYQVTSVLITSTPRPDLVVATVTAPVSAEEGEVASIGWTVRNDGTGLASASGTGGVWEDHIFLSKDTVLSGDDTLLGTFAVVADLDVDEEYSRVENVVLEAGISGPHFLIVRADALNAVVEVQGETNNIGLGLPSIDLQQFDLPDLIVDSVGLSSEFAAAFSGTQATVTWSVRNQDPDVSGKGTANGTWSDRVLPVERHGGEPGHRSAAPAADLLGSARTGRNLHAVGDLHAAVHGPDLAHPGRGGSQQSADGGGRREQQLRLLVPRGRTDLLGDDRHDNDRGCRGAERQHAHDPVDRRGARSHRQPGRSAAERCGHAARSSRRNAARVHRDHGRAGGVLVPVRAARGRGRSVRAVRRSPRP